MSGSGSPAMPHPPKQLLEFFSRSLSSFQSSQDPFRVICTLPHQASSSPTNRAIPQRDDTNAHAAEPSPRRPRGQLKNLVVLDSSFNPPTTAHGRMARSAMKDLFQRQGKTDINTNTQPDADTERAPARLLLLLAVNNADKAPKPASFPVRMAMMEAFGRSLLDQVAGEVDLGVTTMAYFHDKARAIAESAVYNAHSGYGAVDGLEQTYLTGYDTLVRIFDPKYYPGEGRSQSGETTTPMQASLGPFFARAGLRVTSRPDDGWGGREEQVEYVRALGQDGGALDRAGGKAAWMKKVDLVDDGDGWVDKYAGVVSSSRAREVVKSGGVEAEALDGLVDEKVKAWIAREDPYK